MNSPNSTQIYNFIEKLYPICRSITGDGVRETLKLIHEIIPITIKEITSGTEVFDWTIPKEWKIRDAFVKNSKGERIIDFQKSNLHVVNYSIPVNKKVTLKELKKHLYSIPDQPDWIPYRTSYYKEDWGFCLTHNQLQNLEDEIYEIKIDSELFDGNLTYGEFYLEGKTTDEVLISTHICHPSMCNDNLSGISVAAHIGKYLLGKKNHFSYRIIFIPATIGAITWLAQNENSSENIKFGIVLALLGDAGKFNYKKSRNDSAAINKIVEKVLIDSQLDYNIREFTPYGYDERQFCSPGINLPVGTLMRTPNKEFPEYHTSADNLDFVKPEYLNQSYQIIIDTINIIENNFSYINLFPKCEPQLGKRGIYNSVAGDIKEIELAMLWILNYSDGEHDLLDISKRSGLKFEIFIKAVKLLLKHNLIRKIK